MQVLLRPEDIVIEELDENEHSNAIIGRIVDRTYKGMTLESTVEFDHNGKRVLVSEFFNEDDPYGSQRWSTCGYYMARRLGGCTQR